MRDHTKLDAFHAAHALTLAVYNATREMPPSEQFGLTSQMRRAAVSVVSNIVEGSARASLNEYVRFLDMAYGSARELEYQIQLAAELGFLTVEVVESLVPLSVRVCKLLNALIRSLSRNREPTRPAG